VDCFSRILTGQKLLRHLTYAITAPKANALQVMFSEKLRVTLEAGVAFEHL